MTDPYATIRSACLQNQQSLVNGDAPLIQTLPDFDESPPATPTAPIEPRGVSASRPLTTPSPRVWPSVRGGELGRGVGEERSGVLDQDGLHVFAGKTEVGEPRQDMFEYVGDAPSGRDGR